MNIDEDDRRSFRTGAGDMRVDWVVVLVCYVLIIVHAQRGGLARRGRDGTNGDSRVRVFDEEDGSVLGGAEATEPAGIESANTAKGTRGGRGRRRRSGNGNKKFDFRPNLVQLNEAGLSKQVEDILMDAERYHMWWTGPPNDPTSAISFAPEPWSQAHRPQAHAIFTHAVVQGLNDREVCSSPRNLQLWLGSARRYFDGDIVIALETEVLTEEMKAVLQRHRAVVYLLPPALCNIEKTSSALSPSIFCGSAEERVPATAFRYFFYEKWAANYNASSSHILIADFRDLFFQADPFTYRLSDWFPSYQMAVFQEFYPNMVINRCVFNRRVMSECFGEDALRMLGSRVIVSSGAVLGTRDAVILFSHHMTRVSRVRRCARVCVVVTRRCVCSCCKRRPVERRTIAASPAASTTASSTGSCTAASCCRTCECASSRTARAR